MTEETGTKGMNCFWPKCSDSARCREYGSCVAMAQRAAIAVGDFPSKPHRQSSAARINIDAAAFRLFELDHLASRWPSVNQNYYRGAAKSILDAARQGPYPYQPGDPRFDGADAFESHYAASEELPDCMMPDGGQACQAFTDAIVSIEKLKRALSWLEDHEPNLVEAAREKFAISVW